MFCLYCLHSVEDFSLCTFDSYCDRCIHDYSSPHNCCTVVCSTPISSCMNCRLHFPCSPMTYMLCHILYQTQVLSDCHSLSWCLFRFFRHIFRHDRNVHRCNRIVFFLIKYLFPLQVTSISGITCHSENFSLSSPCVW